MKTYRYTSDMFGSESFNTTSLEEFQARVDECFSGCEDWGPTPEIEERGDYLYAVYGDDDNSHCVGEVIDESTG